LEPNGHATYKNETTKIDWMTKREKVYNKFNGKCAYCGCDLQKGWHIDHIEPMISDLRGGYAKPENDNFSNLNPSCASCNVQKNSHTLEQFRRNIKQFVASLNQYSTQYKFAKRYGLVSENDIEVKFYFEQLLKTK